MATNVDSLRAQCRDRLERMLTKYGWKHSRNFWSKHDLLVELDDTGIFFYVIPDRVAGLAWDSMPNRIKDTTLEFPNGVSLVL